MILTSTNSVKDRFAKAIVVARNLEELTYVEEKLRVTSQINRRTKLGRELSAELKDVAWQKSQQLITKGETPF